MTKVLLTGGSGFIAAHTLALLLQRGYSVVTTVRSKNKADKIRETHTNIPPSNLDFRIVEDIAQPGAFDEALQIEGIEVVIHTASPFQFNIKDVKKDLLEPAIIGTTGILSAIKKYAPSVKKVIITSSVAAIRGANNATDSCSVTYTEKSWNPITEAEALENPISGYIASKTFAERAAWEFVEKEKPNFKIATINPPLVYGPVVGHIDSPENVNTSNKRFCDLILGLSKDESFDAKRYPWVDVRDVAIAHVKAFELDEALGNRFLVTAGLHSKCDLVEIIKKNFPYLASKLPSWDSDQQNIESSKYDNSFTTKILGTTQYSLEQSVIDTVNSLRHLLEK